MPVLNEMSLNGEMDAHQEDRGSKVMRAICNSQLEREVGELRICTPDLVDSGIKSESLREGTCTLVSGLCYGNGLGSINPYETALSSKAKNTHARTRPVDDLLPTRVGAG